METRRDARRAVYTFLLTLLLSIIGNHILFGVATSSIESTHDKIFSLLGERKLNAATREQLDEDLALEYCVALICTLWGKQLRAMRESSGEQSANEELLESIRTYINTPIRSRDQQSDVAQAFFDKSMEDRLEFPISNTFKRTKTLYDLIYIVIADLLRDAAKQLRDEDHVVTRNAVLERFREWVMRDERFTLNDRTLGGDIVNALQDESFGKQASSSEQLAHKVISEFTPSGSSISGYISNAWATAQGIWEQHGETISSVGGGVAAIATPFILAAINHYLQRAEAAQSPELREAVQVPSDETWLGRAARIGTGWALQSLGLTTTQKEAGVSTTGEAVAPRAAPVSAGSVPVSARPAKPVTQGIPAPERARVIPQHQPVVSLQPLSVPLRGSILSPNKKQQEIQFGQTHGFIPND